MPTYSYACDACGKSFEKEQRITEDPIKKCPKCGKNKARRMISSGNFILKGGGWYADGYGSGSSSKKPAADSSSNGASSSSKPSKPESSSTTAPSTSSGSSAD